MTFTRYVGEVRSASGASLNDAMREFITANDYPGGIGA
jgi:hypothetical protein